MPMHRALFASAGPRAVVVAVVAALLSGCIVQLAPPWQACNADSECASGEVCALGSCRERERDVEVDAPPGPTAAELSDACEDAALQLDTSIDPLQWRTITRGGDVVG